MDISVEHIIKMYLTERNYDGLWNSYGDCTCLKDDLNPCGCLTLKCMAGDKEPCDCGEHNFHIVRRERNVI